MRPKNERVECGDEWGRIPQLFVIGLKSMRCWRIIYVGFLQVIMNVNKFNRLLKMQRKDMIRETTY